MKPLRSRRVLLAALLVAALGGFVWLALRPHEPVYQGKPLRYWLEAAYAGTHYGADNAKAEQAKEAVKTIGTDALPTLIRMLQASNTDFKYRAAHWANFLLPVYEPESARKLHLVATCGCQILGPEAKPAIPQLVKLLSSSDTVITARSLVNIGPEGVTALVSVLTNNTNPRVLNQVMISLGPICESQSLLGRPPEQIAQIDLEIKMLIPALIQLLQDPSVMVRDMAAVQLDDARDALKQIDPEAAAKIDVK